MANGNLEVARIGHGLPAAAYYIPNFISEHEEAGILESITRTPDVRWTKLSHRRLLSLPSQLTGTARDTLLAAPLPKHLHDPILPRFAALRLFDDSPHRCPNHCLVNEYEPGQGIMPHEDGPAYHPVTATVSLGGHTVLNIYQKNEDEKRHGEPSWRILQEPRSLLITTNETYKNTLHGIDQVEIDHHLLCNDICNWNLLGDTEPYKNGQCERTTRVSLTYRDVLKISKAATALRFRSSK